MTDNGIEAYFSLGFTGGSFLKKRQIQSNKTETQSSRTEIYMKNIKKSVSCPDNLEVDKRKQL